MADTVLISIRVPSELISEADKVSEREERSRAQVLLRWIRSGYAVYQNAEGLISGSSGSLKEVAPGLSWETSKVRIDSSMSGEWVDTGIKVPLNPMQPSEWRPLEFKPEIQRGIGKAEFESQTLNQADTLSETLDAYEGVTGAFVESPKVPDEAYTHLEAVQRSAEALSGVNPRLVPQRDPDDTKAHVRAHLSEFARVVKTTEDIQAAVRAAKGVQDAATKAVGTEGVEAVEEVSGVSSDLEKEISSGDGSAPISFPVPRCPKCHIPMTNDGEFFTCGKGTCRQKPVAAEDVRERYEREQGE